MVNEQEGNLLLVEQQGWGIKIKWEDITHKHLTRTIHHLIGDPQ